MSPFGKCKEVKVGKIDTNSATPFNSPFELGIRMVYLLANLFPKGADLQKLILLDYAAIYSGDFGGPSSLHTPVPYRNAELYVRRELILTGLRLMASKKLIDIRLGENGIIYFAGENSRTLVDSIGEPYLFALSERCRWVASAMGGKDTILLTEFFLNSGCRWEAEMGVIVSERLEK